MRLQTAEEGTTQLRVVRMAAWAVAEVTAGVCRGDLKEFILPGDKEWNYVTDKSKTKIEDPEEDRS